MASRVDLSEIIDSSDEEDAAAAQGGPASAASPPTVALRRLQVLQRNRGIQDPGIILGDRLTPSAGADDQPPPRAGEEPAGEEPAGEEPAVAEAVAEAVAAADRQQPRGWRGPGGRTALYLLIAMLAYMGRNNSSSTPTNQNYKNMDDDALRHAQERFEPVKNPFAAGDAEGSGSGDDVLKSAFKTILELASKNEKGNTPSDVAIERGVTEAIEGILTANPGLSPNQVFARIANMLARKTVIGGDASEEEVVAATAANRALVNWKQKIGRKIQREFNERKAYEESRHQRSNQGKQHQQEDKRQYKTYKKNKGPKSRHKQYGRGGKKTNRKTNRKTNKKINRKTNRKNNR